MLKTNKIFQAAYVVDDIDVAMENWLRVAQIGPFFVMRDGRPETITFRGQPGDLMVDVAYCQAGPMMVELISPKVANPFYPSGTSYHHQAYLPDDFEGEIARFDAMGVGVACQGKAGLTRFAYFDTVDLVGCYTEILDLGQDLVDLFKEVADASNDWDGSDPIRTL